MNKSQNNATVYVDPIARAISADATFCDDIPNVVPLSVTIDAANQLAALTDKGQYLYFLCQSAMDAGVKR